MNSSSTCDSAITVRHIYPANWEAKCKSLSHASSEFVHYKLSFAHKGKIYETKCNDCYPVVNLIEKEHFDQCTIKGHKVVATNIDGTPAFVYECPDCDIANCEPEPSQNSSVEAPSLSDAPSNDLDDKHTDHVPAPVNSVAAELPACCVHDQLVASAPVAAVKPEPPQMIHGLPAEKFRKAEELALQRIAEEKLAEDARELRRNADYIYEVLKQEKAYETAVNKISADIAKEMELLEKKKENFIAETQRQHKAKLDRLRQNYCISQQ
jgi:hypothetical protein